MTTYEPPSRVSSALRAVASHHGCKSPLAAPVATHELPSNPETEALNPKPTSLNPKPKTLNPKSWL